MPVATTLKVALWPACTLWLAGCVVMLGATGAIVTVSTAARLVTLPTELLTTTAKVAPLSALDAAGVV